MRSEETYRLGVIRFTFGGAAASQRN